MNVVYEKNCELRRDPVWCRLRSIQTLLTPQRGVRKPVHCEPVGSRLELIEEEVQKETFCVSLEV